MLWVIRFSCVMLILISEILYNTMLLFLHNYSTCLGDLGGLGGVGNWWPSRAAATGFYVRQYPIEVISTTNPHWIGRLGATSHH